MTLESIADITPNGSTVAVSATPLKATWIKFTPTGTTVRAGDANIGAGRGLLLPNGVVTNFERLETIQGFYDLSKTYVYAAAGTDKVSITYGL